MKKGRRIRQWILLIAAAVVVIFGVGACKNMFKNYVNIHGQHLNTYRNSSGGGMNGGYYSETVKRYDDHALISIESAEWHSQDPTVTEYMTDTAVLNELETIVRKSRMNFWNRKTFTNIFVSDGETESYSFDFDNADISFSSQIYPMKYRNKLAELDRVVKKYIEDGERLPGLINPKSDTEEYYLLPENELEIYVYYYAGNSLGIRILNGTDEEIEIPETFKLINTDTDVVLLEDDTPYGGSFSEHARDEMIIRLNDRLAAGNYKIIFGDLDIPFEIK